MSIIMKKFLAIVLIAIMGVSAMASCSKTGEGHKIYIRDDFFADELKIKFLNSQSEKEETVEPEKLGENDDYASYSVSADTKKYDRLIIDSDGSESIELAFNEYVNGWHLSPYGAVPFTYDEKEGTPDFAIKTFKYAKTDKNIYIHTPKGYKKDSEKKYPVIYMTDGQNLFENSSTPHGCWSVAESVRSMQKNLGKSAVIVGIDDSTSNRDSELTPNIGKVVDVSSVDGGSFNNGTGKYYSDFVVNTVMPYIEKNYNVYADAEHTAVAGSSSGGIESFYIGMEHPDKFGTIGALSPAFGLYDDSTWIKYLKSKNLEGNKPKVYIYNGGSDDLEKFLKEGAVNMVDNLKKVGYKDKDIVFRLYDKGVHNEKYWRAVFPEFLEFFLPKSS